MTTTKIAYAIAVIIPGGLILLACIGIAHVAMVGLKERRARDLALQRVPAHSGVKSRV